ncbi:GNAT family N-acetyltransferase [Bradyrhizobium sp. HKCCYLS2038]|uniref:GNAT family N-acetyltransferase n=1 Tax=unclassified Bradyrhizobium TaxID=2631580 RepID=UPI003EB94B66
MNLHRDKWLSDVLGMSCFRADVDAPGSAAHARTAMLAAGAGRSLVFAKVPTSQVPLVDMLVHTGFRPVDVATGFVHGGGAIGGREATDVTTASPADADQVGALAGRSFTFSRFHADPRIGNEEADAVKREWARNACLGRAAVTYVVKASDRIAGFLAVLLRSGPQGREAIIDLIGVDPAAQGRGIGRALCTRFVNDWSGQADRLVVGTQAANIRALQLYEGLGFRVSETAFVLHAHLKNGEVLE